MADCVIARPSASIFMESLGCGLPMIATGRAPRNDKGTSSVIELYQTGLVCRNLHKIHLALKEILENRAFMRKI